MEKHLDLGGKTASVISRLHCFKMEGGGTDIPDTTPSGLKLHGWAKDQRSYTCSHEL